MRCNAAAGFMPPSAIGSVIASARTGIGAGQ